MESVLDIMKIYKINLTLYCFFVHYDTISTTFKAVNREHIYEKKIFFYGFIAVGSCFAYIKLWNTEAGEETGGARTAGGADFGILGKMFVDAACVHSIYEYAGQ